MDSVHAPTPPVQKRRFFDERLDHFDTEYEEWKVQAGLIEPYYRRVVECIVTEKLTLVDKINGEIIENPQTASPKFTEYVTLPLKPEDQHALYSKELRWRLTELGRETVHWERTCFRSPSGNLIEKIKIDWGRTRLTPSTNRGQWLDAAKGVLIFIIIPILLVGIVTLFIVGTHITLAGLQMIPFAVIIWALIAGKLVPSYVMDKKSEGLSDGSA